MAKELLKQLPNNLLVTAKRMQADLPKAKIYLVGGAVRDLLINRATKDYDLVITDTAIPKLENWLAKHGQVNLVGKTFGVFKWQPAGWAGEALDIALPRTEHVTLGTGQYRDFKIQSNPNLPIADDLLRRDFTINALALNLTTGELTDPSGGQADLKKKIIKTVGVPAKRFNEDLSRTLRAIRQACQLNFTIDKATAKGIKLLSHKANSDTKGGEWLVPREIIARELLKSLAANPVLTLELLANSGFLKELLPEVAKLKKVPQPPEFHTEGDVFEHTKLALKSLSAPDWKKFFGNNQANLNVIVATLLHDIGKPITLRTPQKHGTERIRTDGHDLAGAQMVPDICQRLRLTSYKDPEKGQVNTENITWLVRYHLFLVHGSIDAFKPATLYRYFLKDPNLGMQLQQLIFADMTATKPKDGRLLTSRLKELQNRLTEVRKKLTAGKLKLLLNGNDIMSRFKIKSGPRVGQLMKLLEEAQLSGLVKNKQQAIKYLKQNL